MKFVAEHVRLKMVCSFGQIWCTDLLDLPEVQPTVSNTSVVEVVVLLTGGLACGQSSISMHCCTHCCN